MRSVGPTGAQGPTRAVASISCMASSGSRVRVQVQGKGETQAEGYPLMADLLYLQT